MEHLKYVFRCVSTCLHVTWATRPSPHLSAFRFTVEDAKSSESLLTFMIIMMRIIIISHVNLSIQHTRAFSDITVMSRPACVSLICTLNKIFVEIKLQHVSAAVMSSCDDEL